MSNLLEFIQQHEQPIKTSSDFLGACSNFILALVGLGLTFIAFAFAWKQLKRYTDALNRANKLKCCEIESKCYEIKSNIVAHQIKALEVQSKMLEMSTNKKMQLLDTRRRILKRLTDLIIFVNNYPPHLLMRWTVTSDIKLDANQPAFAEDSTMQNPETAYYQTIMGDLISIGNSDIIVFFPQLVDQYANLVRLAQGICESITYHDNGKVKSYNLDLGKEFHESANKFLDAANKSLL